jgi:hypothetical protein
MRTVDSDDVAGIVAKYGKILKLLHGRLMCSFSVLVYSNKSPLYMCL